MPDAVPALVVMLGADGLAMETVIVRTLLLTVPLALVPCTVKVSVPHCPVVGVYVMVGCFEAEMVLEEAGTDPLDCEPPVVIEVKLL